MRKPTVSSNNSTTALITPSLKTGIAFSALVAVIMLSSWLLLRSFLWISLTPVGLSPYESVKIFLIGTWFDLATLAYLVAPLLLISALLTNRFKASRSANILKWLLIFAITAAIIFGLVAEYFFWQEFTTRFNFIAVDYLIYTKEVIGNIRESYPITLILLAIAVISALITFVSSRYLKLTSTPLTIPKRLKLIPIAIALPFLSAFAINIDQAAQYSTNVYAQELSMNGLFSFAAAMRRNDLDYDRFYATIPVTDAAKILNALKHQDQNDHDFVLDKQTSPFIKRPKNVVLITVESLSAEFLGSYGNQENLTPKLDAIAQQGLVFDKVFATGTRTVRGLEALSLGTPPIPGQAIVRRPHNEHLSTIGEYLEAQGFVTDFVYGGYGYFDNMNAFFKSNDYKVIDRTDFDEKSIVMENVWGVADESLFDNTLKVLDQNAQGGNPFFVQVMTTSNHRPYTFPENRIDLPQGNREGAVKYTDYAIGRFIEQARAKPWFKDTLFVIIADHCAAVAGKTQLPVAKYHIPMIFYAPAIIKPGHFKDIVSQVDVPPTLLDVLGYDGSQHFFGRNVFKRSTEKPRAFISNYQSLGYYKDEQLIVLLPKRKIEAFKIDPLTFEAEPMRPNPKLVSEAIAYYQSASLGFKNGSLQELPINTKNINASAGKPSI
jgi:phosphoglycerol transferase MdoB-like AlkP superfamily enzyme